MLQCVVCIALTNLPPGIINDEGLPVMPIAVIVQWYGPYHSLKEIDADTTLHWADTGRALYMALRSYNNYQYIGLTTRPATRIVPQHSKLAHRDNKRYFVGEIVTQGISGRRTHRTPPDLSLAEHALIRYLQPSLNVRNRDTNPDDLVSIFSCFYSPADYETPINPLRRFPKLLAFNPDSEEWIESR